MVQFFLTHMVDSLAHIFVRDDTGVTLPTLTSPQNFSKTEIMWALSNIPYNSLNTNTKDAYKAKTKTKTSIHVTEICFILSADQRLRPHQSFLVN